MQPTPMSAKPVSGVFARTTTTPGTVIRSLIEAVNASCGQQALQRLEPLLMFLMLLRDRRPRPGHGSSPGLPAGCVLAVRYQSR